MGYYADGNGFIRFARPLNDKEEDYVGEKLAEVMENVDYDQNIVGYDVWTADKYHGDDEVLEALRSVAQSVPVLEGEINYAGEDGCFWRFIYRDGDWITENGRIIYESDPGYSLPGMKPQPMDESWSPSDKDACEALY